MPGGPPWMFNKFKECGCRSTKPREYIIEILESTKEHLTAEDIYFHVHKVYPAIGLTTVYRTLELLVGMGVLIKIDFGDGKSRYELTDEFSSKHHHHHLICNNCNKIFDYSDFMEAEKEFLKKIENALSKKYNFSIHNHNIQFFGICQNCSS